MVYSFASRWLRFFVRSALVMVLIVCHGCDESVGSEQPAVIPNRIYHSPYQDVDWGTTLRIKAQHHDHGTNRIKSVQAYDRAGYGALSLMDYSGAPEKKYALTHALWPPESFGITQQFRNQLTNIKLFLPNAEEVGEDEYHITAPFLTTFIRKFTPLSSTDTPQPWEYSNPQELIDLVKQFDAIPMLAHPWNASNNYLALNNFRGIEIYSAFADVMKRRGEPVFTTVDRNAALIDLWDRLLATNSKVLGIAVNDHFGPDAAPDTVDEDLKDSGKIIVLASEMSLSAYRQAFEAGAFLAVKDISTPKDQYPVLRQVSIEKTSIMLDTEGNVRWIVNGHEISKNSLLQFSEIPARSTYLRAEISDAKGNTLYTQAFSIKPVGDANGDGAVNASDQEICNAVKAGTETLKDRVNACQ